MPRFGRGYDQDLLDSQTIAITGNANPEEFVPARVDRRPVITHLWFTASGATNLTFNSFNGSTDTALSGVFAANTGTTPNTWGGYGEPVFIANATGDSIRVVNSGAATLVGFAVVKYLDR